MSGFDPITSHAPGRDTNVSERAANSAADMTTDPTAARQKLAKEAEDQHLLLWFGQCWQEARDAHAPNRTQMHLDADYYDHMQIDPETQRTLLDRGQAPLTYNLVKAACDWVIGTERRTRVDWKIHPRGPEDEEVAQAKQHAMKYVDDANNGTFARSAAFSHAVKVGVGWTEECIDPNTDREPIVLRNEDWKAMWWDPYAQALDLSDARYIIRSKWLDVDFAIALWPQHEGAIVRNARAADDVDLEDNEDPADIPGMFFGHTTHQHDAALRASGGAFASGRRLRNRIRVLEIWYRKPKKVTQLRSLDLQLDRQPYDQANPEHQRALATGYGTLHQTVRHQTCVALFVPGQILHRQETPYRHNRYPFTPYFAYRNDKSRMPYGLIRGMRDAQDDYNKRRAKALYLLSVNRVLYEAGAIDEEDEEDFLAEAAQPDAKLRVNNNALMEGRVKFESGAELVPAQMNLMEQDRLHIFEGNGVTRENLGQESNAISGRAILAKQQQGAVTTAELFDNYRFGFRCSGQKVLSLTEQFMTMPKRLRILGAKNAYTWLVVNEPSVDPATGEVFFKNDIAAQEADFYIDQQDYRETVRMAMAETLFEVIKGLDPTLQVQLLDLAIELTDIPNREEFARRIRSINGQTAPGEAESPEAQLAKKQQAEAQAAEQQLAQRERAAKADKDEAAALEARMRAKKTHVEGQAAALNTAQILAGAVPLSPVADRLAEFPQPQVTGP